MTTELMVYQFDSQSNQRVHINNGKEWICAYDACRILGIGNITDVVRRIPKHYLNKIEVVEKQSDGRVIKRWMWFVDEAGLNYLIMRSNKPAAKNYKEWVCSVVLPSIRKTGSYSVSQDNTSEKTVKMLISLGEIVQQLVKDVAEMKAKSQLTAGPEPINIPALTLRDRFNMDCRNIARKYGWAHDDVYNMVYYEFKYRYNADLRQRARNNRMIPIEYADKQGWLRELCMIAEAILVGEIQSNYMIAGVR